MKFWSKYICVQNNNFENEPVTNAEAWKSTQDHYTKNEDEKWADDVIALPERDFEMTGNSMKREVVPGYTIFAIIVTLLTSYAKQNHFYIWFFSLSLRIWY